MPNHVTNILTISGEEAYVANVMKAIRGNNDNELIDFMVADPMPKELLDGDGWYGWRSMHWGTKWNAYDSESISENEIQFLTAWSTPEEAIKKFSSMFPEASFRVVYADEDIGYNCGEYTYDEGEIANEYRPDGGSDDAMEYYFQTHEDNRDLFRKNAKGEWEYAVERW